MVRFTTIENCPDIEKHLKEFVVEHIDNDNLEFYSIGGKAITETILETLVGYIYKLDDEFTIAVLGYRNMLTFNTHDEAYNYLKRFNI